MKKIKKVLIIFISFSLILGAFINTSRATSAELSTAINNVNVKKGETFTVKLSASSEDGINGVSGSYSYDESKVELVSVVVADSSKFSNMAGQGTKEIALMALNAGYKNEDLLTFTFKVKDTAVENSDIVISFNDMEIDTYATSNPAITIGTKTVTAKVAASTNTDKDNTGSGEGEKPGNTTDNNTDGNTTGNKTDNTDGNTTGNKTDNTDGNTTGNTTDNTDGNTTGNTTDNTDGNTTGNKTDDKDGNTTGNIADNKVGNTNVNNNKITNTNNSTNANKILPYTGGATKVIIICIAIICIGAIVTLKKYNDYKDI